MTQGCTFSELTTSQENEAETALPCLKKRKQKYFGEFSLLMFFFFLFQ